MSKTDPLAFRVLLIEDEPFVRATLRRMLGTLGCSDTREAADGSEALRLLQSDDFLPDLIICDVHMEPMDGISFVQELRSSTRPEQARVPIILLTALSDGARLTPSASLAVSRCLSKPVYGQQLAECISGIFGRPVGRRRHSAAEQ